MQCIHNYICCMKQLKTSVVLMIAAITAITVFQVYWITRLYKDEKLSLQKQTDILLNETLQRMQSEKIKKANFFFEPEMISSLKVVKPQDGKKNKKAEIIVKLKDSLINTPAFTLPEELIMQQKNSSISDGKPKRIFLFKDSSNNILKADSFIHAKSISSISFQRKTRDSVQVIASLKPKEKTADKKIRKDSVTTNNQRDTTILFNRSSTVRFSGDSNSFKKFIVRFNAINDSIPVKKVDSAYRLALTKAGIQIPFSITIQQVNKRSSSDSLPTNSFSTGFAYIGLEKPFAYQAHFGSPVSQIFSAIKLQIIFSLFIICITTAAFVFLYRNLRSQQKLAVIKNEFISNITHELKTPIATVSVALEALKNFNAIQNPAKTKEYLDISEAELQRLSLLVDKVLKLSMFEHKAIELNKETVYPEKLISEILSTMKLQFEKQQAKVYFTADADITLQADKLHFTSVVYNLIDNALKYSGEKAEISITLRKENHMAVLEVKDNGIGIPAAYQQRIFEKFFRVPTNNRHNIKGYGLGLSYVYEVIKKHNGSISVKSETDKGSTFIIQLPA